MRPHVMSPDGARKLPLIPAPLDIEVADIWPPGACGPEARAAYERLSRAGRIAGVTVWTDPANGRTVVKYRADIPAGWIRRELAGAKALGKQQAMILGGGED